MDFVQLRVVLEIQKAGSLTKAGMHINKSQSFVSQCLTAFEREFGGRVFYRNGRGVIPTELGERILPYVQEIVRTLDQMVESAVTPGNAVAGNVRVCISPSVSDKFASRLFAEVKQELPFVRLQLDDSDGNEIDGALERGDADVAVLLRNGSTLGTNDKPICVYDTCLIGQAGDPFLMRPEILFRDLEHLPLLVRSEPSLLRTTINRLAAAKGISLSIEAEVNSQRAVRLLLESGAGYMVAPIGRGPAEATCDLGPLLRTGQLQAARICDPQITRTLVVASNPGKGQRVNAVSDAAVKVLKAMMLAPEEMADELPCASTLGASAIASAFLSGSRQSAPDGQPL